MISLKIYSVAHREFYDNAISRLTDEEKDDVTCYIVNEKFPKDFKLFTTQVDHLKEYELLRYNPIYQEQKYYEYSFIPHVYLNQDYFKQYTYIGMLHSDIYYNKNAINDIKNKISQKSNTWFYHIWFNAINHPISKHPLYFTDDQLYNICSYMTSKLKMFINASKILLSGWIGSMLIAPVDVYIKFGKFIEENYKDFEDIIDNNRWGIQNTARHTVCGFVERLWGFYLSSYEGINWEYIDIVHDRNAYKHEH